MVDWPVGFFKLQPFKFTISHRKGKEHIVPDALSRIPQEISELELPSSEIDLNSEHFADQDYEDLKEKVKENQSRFPDIKIINNFVYYRTQHYRGIEEEQDAWKLWVPNALRKETISRSHDSTTAVHGGMSKTIHLLKRHFYWPGLVQDVRNYIRDCKYT